MDKDRVLAEFPLEDGTVVRVEVPRPLDEDAVEEVSGMDETLYKARETFESALDKMTPVVLAVTSRIKKGLTANEVEVKFGLNLSVESGVIISSVGGDVNFEITLKWKEG